MTNSRIKRIDPIAELCEQVIKLGQTGATQRVIALEIGLSQTEIAELRNKYPIFDTALKTADDFSLGFHERLALQNLNNKAFSTQLHGQLLKANWPSMYAEATMRKDLNSSKSNPEEIDFSSSINQLIQALKASED